MDNNKPRNIDPQDLPEDYVDLAEKCIRDCKRDYNPKLKFDIVVSTSKLRNLLSMITDSYHAESRNRNQHITDETKEALNNFRKRVVYEIGRDKSNHNNFGQFEEKVRLQEYLKGINGDRKALLRFFHYMEALVAYHKYYGGRD